MVSFGQKRGADFWKATFASELGMAACWLYLGDVHDLWPRRGC